MVKPSQNYPKSSLQLESFWVKTVVFMLNVKCYQKITVKTQSPNTSCTVKDDAGTCSVKTN